MLLAVGPAEGGTNAGFKLTTLWGKTDKNGNAASIIERRVLWLCVLLALKKRVLGGNFANVLTWIGIGIRAVRWFPISCRRQVCGCLRVC